MKTLAILSISLLTAVSASAQGTVNFNNKVADTGSGVVNAPFYDLGGTALLAGPNAWAQLYAGPSADTLAPIGAAAQFRTGTGAGYWNAAPNSTRTIPTVAPGASAFVKVAVWKGPSGSTCENHDSHEWCCRTLLFSVVTGGAGSPPSLPAPLLGLTSCAFVPEPSTLALGALGAAALILCRRRSQMLSPPS